MTTIGSLSFCSNHNSNQEVIEQNVILKNSETYTYDMGFFGDEEGAGIQTQAEYFELSELETDYTTGQVTYKYKPTAAYVGRDYVEISAGRGSDGASDNTEITIVKITFHITE